MPVNNLTMSRILTGALGAIALVATLWVGVLPTGPVPPLGGLLDPVHGVWGLAATAAHPQSAHAAIPNLTAPVEVRYDDRGVPHIFAANELDATRALGFVVARDRLFQLELQTRAANGTLTELVGAVALDTDQDTRRIGLPWGARRKFDGADVSSHARAAAAAYSDGVNAYIAQMSRAELPLEYRLLNRRPQRWEPEHTMLLLVRMGQTLAWSESELWRDELAARVGAEAADALFPVNAYLQEPIQPASPSARSVPAVVIPPPLLPPMVPAGIAQARRGPVRASNNWAVSPRRSASGFALLANDPHLELSLPSTWYEAHLVVRDTLDVYGVTLPGSTSITLGVTRDIAWGATNVGADVADYYVETVDDSLAPARYLVDGAWRDVTRSIETYRGPAGDVIAVDTLYYTHRGPLFLDGSRWTSRRWLVLEGATNLDAFAAAARARSVREFFDAMADFDAPAQNFVVADRGGHIGIRSTGKYPIRPGNRGDTVFDGSSSRSDWSGWITATDAPHAIDPPQGYVASANQQPVDPRDGSRYFGNEWPAPWRALHINRLLRSDSAVTADAMRRYQTDPGNARADLFVPLFLSAARHAIGTGADPDLARAASLLAEWDRLFTAENERAILFENAMRELGRRTWDELGAGDLGPDSVFTRFIAFPYEHVLAALTRDPGNAWWDVRTTPHRETRDDVLAASLRAGLRRTERERGPEAEGGWRWSRIRFANIWHPLRIAALSALEVPVQGGRESLNPSSGDGTHGASWRLVAEMGPEVRAWGIYPGGQSANPVSEHYRDRIETWSHGELDSLRIPRAPDALSPAHHAATLFLRPAR